MYSKRNARKTISYAVCTALAASMVAGCAGSNPFAKVNSNSAVVAKAGYSDEKDLAKAEKAVAEQPRDAALRVELASAYLAAGRFESAVTTYNDAIALGDTSPRTALSLALAYVGTGRNADALALLDQWRDSIPASDYGLAVALAGDTSRGVMILGDAFRAGNSDAKLRQNLAYAFALDGRWLEARLMAAQDLPADQLDARISDWAMQGRSEDYRKRVAGLLGAPVRSDPGQPEFLALSNGDGEAPALADGSDRELPPVQGGEGFGGVENKEPAPLLTANESHVAAPPSPVPAEPWTAPESPAMSARNEAVSGPAGHEFDQAFAAPASTSRHVSRPVVQPSPSRDEPVAAAVSSESAYLVQLGSFSSPENAQRAWTIYQRRYPSLRDHDLRITEAVVRGKKFWRVAAAGYDNSSARTMCSNVKGRGYGCIAYAESRPLPGALPQAAGSGPMRARR